MSTYTSNYGWTKPEGSDPVDIGVLNNNLDSQDNIVHNAYMQLAPVFSTASTYAVDDVVLYSNNLYKCHTAVTVAGDWDASKWTQVKVSDIAGGGGGGGTSDYDNLTNRPQINGTTLTGNKTASDLGLAEETTVITWADWILLTPQEQESGDYTVVGCPWADGDVSVDLLTKLWENPNPTSSFPAQTIAVDVSGYQFVGIFIDGEMSVIRVGGGRTAIFREGFSNNNVLLFRRVFNADGANGIVVEDASGYTQGQSGTTDNARNIPTVIYGIKTTASVKINAVAMDVKASVEYSTSEHLIGKWIDGSDLYEKTIDFGALPNATTKSVSSGLSNVTIRNVECIANRPQLAFNLPWCTNTGSSNINAYYSYTTNEIVVRDWDDYSAMSAYVTLRYTKNS